MSVPLLDLKRENQPLLADIQKAIEPILESSLFIMGNPVAELEKSLSSYLQTSHVLGVSSGTDALLLSLMAMNLPQGSHVLTTPFTFFATVGAIHRAGLLPVFADIDEHSFNIDAALVANYADSEAGKKVKALLPVHLFGQAADMDALMQSAQHNSWLVLEDCAQSIGAKYKGKPLGTIGDFGAYSFFPTKNLGAFGDGGLVTIQNESYNDKTARMRVHGMKDRYDHWEVGGNFRLDALQSAILQVKLAHLDTWHNMRRENAKLYAQLFEQKGLQEFITLPIERAENFHIYNQYVIRVKDNKRDALQKHLAQQEIGSAIYYPTPMHLLKSFSYLGHKEGDFPRAEKACREVLALPIHSYIRADEIEQVVESIANFFKR